MLEQLSWTSQKTVHFQIPWLEPYPWPPCQAFIKRARSDFFDFQLRSTEAVAAQGKRPWNDGNGDHDEHEYITL